MKVSFVATVFNEQKTIGSFLKSVFWQSRIPDEIIIVDGGSRDRTVANIKSQILNIKNKKIRLKLVVKKGNRAVGRNEAIKSAINEIILCSDAGCILDKNWVKNIIEPFNDPKVDIVAGYYKGKSSSVFEKSLIPYVLVMPDKVDVNNFLPATRSMAFKKFIWKKAGGFNERYSNNEDYVFAHKIKNLGANIFFEKRAIVNWIPRKNIKDVFKMFFRFALGDAESGILREKILLLFARYILAFYFLLLSFIERSVTPLYIIILGFFLYIIWSIKKNYKYIRDMKALFFLPLLQFVSDISVISGTIIGFLKTVKIHKILQVMRNNRAIVVIIGTYILLMLVFINWGIPNKSHPFNYFMDEWHQAQAVRTVFSQGSPNVPGSANGSMFHFLFSGLFLIPFAIAGIINPFAIKSSVEAFEMQQKLFQVLRLDTLFFGVISIILIVYIARKYFKLNPIFVSFLFVVNPIWLTLSNYFKYDIALIFWIILSFLFILRYSVKSSFNNYGLAAFISGLAFSVKVSALPLLPILLVSYCIFTEKRERSIRHLISGLFIFFATFSMFGIPDLILGKGNINEYLYDNLVRTPDLASNYILGMNYAPYLIIRGGSTIFGFALFFLSIIALIFITGYLLKNKFNETINRKYFLIFSSLSIFIISLLFLKIEARSNRLLVLLPFITLISGIFMDKMLKLTRRSIKKIIIFTLLVFLSLQAIESFSWVSLKLRVDLRQSSSGWITKNIPLGSTVGIENIPIYQSLPDVLLKDYYLSNNGSKNARYTYEVIDGSFIKLPSFIIVTNEEIAKNYIVKSSKRDLIEFLERKNYKKIFYTKQESALFRTFVSELDYFMSGLIQEPLSISVYKI